MEVRRRRGRDDRRDARLDAAHGRSPDGRERHDETGGSPGAGAHAAGRLAARLDRGARLGPRPRLDQVGTWRSHTARRRLVGSAVLQGHLERAAAPYGRYEHAHRSRNGGGLPLFTRRHRRADILPARRPARRRLLRSGRCHHRARVARSRARGAREGPHVGSNPSAGVVAREIGARHPRSAGDGDPGRGGRRRRPGDRQTW